MKTIILCGGKGIRLHEETEFKPKPIVRIGTYPILLHIMNIYAHYGHKDFILCLGYKGEMIKDYFLTMGRYSSDFQFDMKTGKVTPLGKGHNLDYNITFLETGEDTQTAGRVLQAMDYIDEEYFMVTYGDGLSDLNINTLIDFHMAQEKKVGTVATITSVHPHSKFGKITFNEDNVVTTFEEKKPVLDDYINGGFHVYNRKAIEYMKYDEMLEDSLIKITDNRKLSMLKHDGFWHSMDTMKDVKSLNEMWDTTRPWLPWEHNKKRVSKNSKAPIIRDAFGEPISIF